jgi:hypothetical protein
MSEFGDRIRHARRSTKPVEVPRDEAAVGAHAQPPQPPRAVDDPPADAEDPPPEAESQPEPESDPRIAELEAHRRQLDDLARKIDALNAAILHEILRQPGGAAEYPRTVAALADGLADRAGGSSDPRPAR